MSILKGIMHHWNKTKNDYDVIHPETDYKKITDWNEGIVATLASTALGNLVSTMTSDSLLAKMIQLVLTATGVKYSTGQNGYLCFGSLGGGTIIQWINQAIGTNKTNISLPIAYTQQNFANFAIESHVSWNSTKFNIFGISDETLSTITVYSRWCDSGTVNDNGGSACIISIGI